MSKVSINFENLIKFGGGGGKPQLSCAELVDLYFYIFDSNHQFLMLFVFAPIIMIYCLRASPNIICNKFTVDHFQLFTH